MVFANLSNHEKTAFFALLDEYFASRPEILASAGAHGNTPSSSSADREDPATAILHSAGSAVHRALASHPEATSKLVSAGLKHGVPKTSPYSAAASDPETRDAMGRVAAASLSYSAPSNTNNSFGHKLKPPPPAAPGRRAPSPAASHNHSKWSGADSSSDTGDVDTTRTDVSSARSLFESLRNLGGHPAPPAPSSSDTRASAPPPPAPSFAAKKNAFTAPPVRRAPSSTGPPAPPPRRQPTPPPDEPEEEEEQGEWAEALYDFTSAESTDLELEAKQRVLVVEKTSDDWWTGEINGRKGLFPASYVKLL